MRAAGGQNEALQALREMRSARRRRFVEQLDVMEVLYRIYVVAIFGAIGLAAIAGAVNDADVSAGAAEDIVRHGPALLGLGIALAILAGLRSGARGGPLAIEAAEVQYVLLAPIDRGVALRSAALRQMRIATLAGAAAGVVAGNFTFRQLPGSPVEWFACLALFGAAIPLCTLGCALLASGRRIGTAQANAIGAALLAWGLADVLLGMQTSPMTMLGALATLPLQSGGGPVALSVGGIAIAVAAAGLGLGCIGGLSLDAARRRATLTAELRFSASVQDLRTVVLLRRQLASEHPQRKPWARLRAPMLARASVVRRGWQSFLRWPVPRVVRVLILGVAAGVLAAGAWSGVTPLAALAGIALLVAALDCVEPLAQEVDHPLRRDLLPIGPDSLILRHLIAPTFAMGLVVLTGVLAAMALGAPGTAAGVGAVIIGPTAFLVLCCAALSVTKDPYQYVLFPERGYVETALPVVVAMASVAVPVLAARETAKHGASPEGAAAAACVSLLVVAGAMAWWLGRVVAEQRAVKP
jgi:hypothetical protein